MATDTGWPMALAHLADFLELTCKQCIVEASLGKAKISLIFSTYLLASPDWPGVQRDYFRLYC